jgi:hypothetical protein
MRQLSHFYKTVFDCYYVTPERHGGEGGDSVIVIEDLSQMNNNNNNNIEYDR